MLVECIVAVISAATAVVCCSLGGYILELSRFDTRGKQKLLAEIILSVHEMTVSLCIIREERRKKIIRWLLSGVCFSGEWEEETTEKSFNCRNLILWAASKDVAPLHTIQKEQLSFYWRNQSLRRPSFG